MLNEKNTKRNHNISKIIKKKNESLVYNPICYFSIPKGTLGTFLYNNKLITNYIDTKS